METRQRTSYRWAAGLISGGLLFEMFTLQWAHPTAFVLFILIGGTLVGLGVLAFVWALVR